MDVGAAGGERRGGAILAADLDDIDETARGQQGCTRALPLQQGVGGDGSTMHNLGVNGCLFCGGGQNTQVGQPGQNRPALVGRRGRLLVHSQAAIFQEHEIGKCSANIDSNQGSRHNGSS